MKKCKDGRIKVYPELLSALLDGETLTAEIHIPFTFRKMADFKLTDKGLRFNDGSKADIGLLSKHTTSVKPPTKEEQHDV